MQRKLAASQKNFSPPAEIRDGAELYLTGGGGRVHLNMQRNHYLRNKFQTDG